MQCGISLLCSAQGGTASDIIMNLEEGYYKKQLWDSFSTRSCPLFCPTGQLSLPSPIQSEFLLTLMYQWIQPCEGSLQWCVLVTRYPFTWQTFAWYCHKIFKDDKGPITLLHIAWDSTICKKALRCWVGNRRKKRQRITSVKCRNRIFRK